ncbi:MAG: DegT/DnrJ/EryC1/StrS family aminotransferase [Candidatus Bathyarchaeota archaeon]|nr:DegT/DnrJ/EryC1/StrS family aminotransferase [Candidatus Bathyarchaeota archaeon]
MEKLAIDGGRPVCEKKIPIAKPVFRKETVSGISEVLQSGNLRQGPIVKRFEDEFSQKVGAKCAYAANSGTAALHVAYMSILKCGDEVIVPDFTFIATASTVVFSGGRPVFADIDGETLTVNLEDVKEKITPKTKAIAPVHLFGNAADMKALAEIAEDHRLFLVNDAAQAHGPRIDGRDVGSYDHMNCYSFYPTKTITTGEGGMVTTNDEELCERGKLIRNHGQESQYLHKILGLNYRMTEIAAVLGLSQLDMIDEFLAKRRRNAEILTEGISSVPGLEPQRTGRGVEHSYSYYTVIMSLDRYKCSRDEFIEALQAENVGCMVYYPIPLTKQPALRSFADKASCTVAEETSGKVFSIPVHPSLTDQDLSDIIKALEKVSAHFVE